jgi:hypothetical protein
MARPAAAFWWLARDLSLRAWTNQRGVLTRSTTATAADVAGTSSTLANHQPAWGMIDLDGDTVRERVALQVRTGGSELVTFPFKLRPRALTIYTRHVERRALASANPLWLLGAAGSGARAGVYRNGSGHYTGFHHNGTTSSENGAGAAPTLNASIRLRYVLRATGQCQLYQTVNEGSETTAGASPASPALAAAWAAESLILNLGDATTYGEADWLCCAVLPGEVSLAECRGLE